MLSFVCVIFRMRLSVECICCFNRSTVSVVSTRLPLVSASARAFSTSSSTVLRAAICSRIASSQRCSDCRFICSFVWRS
uniref:Putative secreted protein n=1 Tax=Anopheles darlingi TaxID=43151 RepID=A0A2M4D5E4_ANODA